MARVAFVRSDRSLQSYTWRQLVRLEMSKRDGKVDEREPVCRSGTGSSQARQGSSKNLENIARQGTDNTHASAPKRTLSSYVPEQRSRFGSERAADARIHVDVPSVEIQAQTVRRRRGE